MNTKLPNMNLSELNEEISLAYPILIPIFHFETKPEIQFWLMEILLKLYFWRDIKQISIKIHQYLDKVISL